MTELKLIDEALRLPSSPDLAEKKLICSECDSDDILFQVWVDEYNEVQEDGVVDKVWCRKCQDRTKPEIRWRGII